MYDFHAANQRLHHLLFHAAEVSQGEPLDQARAALVRFVARGAEASEFAVEDPELTGQGRAGCHGRSPRGAFGHLRQAKHEHDPGQVLTPGYEVFEGGRP